MKLKVFIGCILVAVMLSVTSPALALSLGVSPSQLELEVPGNGSATANVNIHYFDGDVKVSLIDIPLRIEPQTIHVEASDEPVAIELTIYGDDSLGSQVYNGYIRFIAVSGGAATGGVQVIAKINHIVAGQPLPEETPAEETLPPEAAPAAQGGIGGLPLSTVIIIAGGLVFLGLVALAISLAVRRPRY